MDEINVVSIAQFRAIAPSTRKTDFRCRRRTVRPATGCQASPAATISIAVWLSKAWLGVVEAASDDPRIQRDHRGGGKHNYVFHNFSWLICCGELLKDALSATGAGAIGDVTPKIAARCDCALHRLIERARQPRET
jgi:hypothetical protein